MPVLLSARAAGQDALCGPELAGGGFAVEMLVPVVEDEARIELGVIVDRRLEALVSQKTLNLWQVVDAPLEPDPADQVPIEMRVNSTADLFVEYAADPLQDGLLRQSCLLLPDLSR
jgi:hypothetical protein